MALSPDPDGPGFFSYASAYLTALSAPVATESPCTSSGASRPGTTASGRGGPRCVGAKTHACLLRASKDRPSGSSSSHLL